MIIAIDGPSGVGKSTVGKTLASRLRVPYLDTGAMYRAVGLAVKREGVRLPIEDADVPRASAVAEGAEVEVIGSPAEARTLLNGEDVSQEIRLPEISRYASAVSALAPVRRRLAAMQRQLALAGGGVLEGRDIGTKVVPETRHKFFLSARPEVRADRRFRELQAKGTPQPLDEVLRELNARDHADSTRAESPLVCDETYVPVDTSALTIDEVVEVILQRIETTERSG